MTKKLVILDWGGITHRAIFAFRNNSQVPFTYTMLRMVIGYLKKIGITLDDKVVVAEDYGSWRKDIDKEYKAQRKDFRESKESAEWWSEVYKEANEFTDKLDQCLPFNFIKIYKMEADDIASMAVRYLEAEEKILISSDEDWQMLCTLPNVKVFSPYTKKYKIIKNPEKILLKKIKGDRCLEGHTPIVMADDTRKMIKDLKKGELVATYNFKTYQIENQPILNIGKSMSDKRRLIYLDNEKVPLKITLNHKLYTKRGWITAKDIRVSDIIYKYNELKYMIKTNVQHNFYKLGYLHGYLIGDGSITKYKEVTFTSVDLDGLERIQQYLIDLFNYPTSIDIAKEGNYKPNYKQVYEINIKKDLKDNLFKYFMLKLSINNKIIRRQYYRGFISGFFDAEGSCYPKILKLKNKEERIVWGITLSNTNKNYIEYICKCLKLFNIHFKIYSKILNSKKTIYKIELTNTTKNINFFLLFRPAIRRKYPDLKILSNGKRVRTINTIKVKKGFNFINYNIKTKNHNYFANDLLVHNSDNLLEAPKTEAEFEKRRMIVDLIHLPQHIESIIKPVIETLPMKNIYLNKIPFRSCREEIRKLYKLEE